VTYLLRRHRIPTDTIIVTVGTWTFRKEDATLTLQQCSGDGDEVVLVVGRSEGVREFAFPNLDALTRFQESMETFLLRTGWTLANFSPERRIVPDRRTFPRITNDRRRWWTDGLKG
jgi:hypothetical protein